MRLRCHHVLPLCAAVACGGTLASVESLDDAGPTGDERRDVADAGGGGTRDASVAEVIPAPDAPVPTDAAREMGTGGCNRRPPIPPGVALPAPNACEYADGGTSFPLFDKCCTTETDCVMA